MDTAPEFHAEAPQVTVSEGLVQGPYVAAKAGVKPMTLRTKGVDSTNEPPTPHTYSGCPEELIEGTALILLSTIVLTE